MKTVESSGSEGSGANGGAGSRPKLEPRVQDALGRELRAMYDEVVSEPVPDRFVELLAKLEASERAGDGQLK